MELFNYFIRSTETMVCMGLVFFLFFRWQTFYTINRFYLLILGICAVVIPLLQFTNGHSVQPPVVLNEVLFTASDSTAYVLQTKTDWPLIIWIVYFSGLVVSLSFFVYRLMRLYRFNRAAVFSGERGIYFLPEGSNENFSFLNRIYLSPSLEDEERETIVAHEKVHVQQKHSLDILFYEMLCIIFWFNPLYRLIKKELMASHEFIADQKAGSGKTVNYARVLVARAFGVPVQTFHSFSTTKSLKRRLIMLNKKRSSKKIIAVYLMALPLSVSTFFIQSFAFAPAKEKRQTAVVLTDKEAEFKGGHDALIRYLTTNLKYPAEAKNKKIQGKVFVEFVIADNGKIKDVAVKKGINKWLDEEAVRVIKSMPDWEPAVKEGKQVSTSMILPINFQLD